MNWLELLYDIFKVCILPLLGVLTTFIVKFLRAKSGEIIEKIDSELAEKYLQMLTETVISCVVATNQTYVDALKKQGEFNIEAQKKAFEKTYEAVLAILGEEAKNYLSEAYGDLDVLIKTLIESYVNTNKITTP